MQGNLAKRGLVAASIAAVLAVAVAAPAPAAVTVGQVVVPTEPCSSGMGTVTRVQSTSPANRYEVPSAGVITRWRYQTGELLLDEVRLKLLRPAGADMYTTVGHSDVETPAGGLNIFAARISVLAGDTLGFNFRGSNAECLLPSMDYGTRFVLGDPPIGTTSAFSSESAAQLPIEATVEPDADGDGFGDETQDGCPRVIAQQVGACIPDTAITRKPKKMMKTSRRKARVTFEFTSTEPGSTFECQLDKRGYKPCTSPAKFKVRVGKHTFSVRALNGTSLDTTAASYAWKVKRKR